MRIRRTEDSRTVLQFSGGLGYNFAYRMKKGREGVFLLFL